MVLRWRRRLFYSLIFVFLALGGAVILYAQGWRIDFETLAVNKVGAMYVRSFPQDAAVTLDGKAIERSFGFFENGTLVNHLLPKRYLLEISNAGYRPWHEHIEIEPSLVTEVTHAVLVPEEAGTVAEGIADFWVIRGELLLRDSHNMLSFKNRRVSGSEVIGWTEDAARLLTRETSTKRYAWNDLENGESVRLPNLGTMTPVADPYDANSVLLVASSSLMRFTIENGNRMEIAKLGKSTITALSATESWIAWTTTGPAGASSSLSIYDKSGGAIRTQGVILEAKAVQLAWNTRNRLGILLENGSFLLFDPSAQTLEKTASDVKDIAFTEDGSMVAALEHSSIEVFSLDGKSYWRFNVQDVGTITHLEWYKDNNHFFLHYPDRVMFLDLDDRSQENLTLVAETAQGAYDLDSNQFYFLKNGALQKLDFPE